MTTATELRTTLARFAEELGWQRNAGDRVDVYVRGLRHVQVAWSGGGKIAGASHHEDSVLLAYSRDEGKIRSWLAK